MTDCVIISRWYCVKYVASIELLILCKADILSRKLSVHCNKVYRFKFSIP